MKIIQKRIRPEFIDSDIGTDVNADINLVLGFADRKVIEEYNFYKKLRSLYKSADILISSSSGEIFDSGIADDEFVYVAIEFEKSQINSVCHNYSDFENSTSIGEKLVSDLPQNGLSHVLIFAEGQLINGSQLAEGINNKLPPNVAATGGMAGDGIRFSTTLVGLNDIPREGNVVAIGLYGDNLEVCYSSQGGWDLFGPERLITKSKGNILYEVDGKPALDLYKKYLGELSIELPASALLFPLSIKENEGEESIVRTIVNVNEDDNSLIFAGDMPEGFYARLMRANINRLVDGAHQAAQDCMNFPKRKNHPELALLVSCVGRKLVLNNRIEEEIDTIKEIFGIETKLTGYYSYGEIAPSHPLTKSMLHNQTMTITTISEL